MADKRHHRGPHPGDPMLFAKPILPRLNEAVAHLSWLLSRGYAQKSSIKLVGDRFSLTDRQRIAVMRCACADDVLGGRRIRELDESAIAGESLAVDGYNVITTIEAALSGGVVLAGRDGCCRDLASMHGHYKKVEETVPAIHLIGETMAALRPREVVWYLDSPVSNSGRLRQMLADAAEEKGWPWRVEMVRNPDPVLMEDANIIITADSVILDNCTRWFNMARRVIREHIPQVWMVELSATLKH